MRRVRPATGEIELDLGRYELRRLGRRVKLEKKPMELLIFLVSRREQLISREEIVGKLWRSDLFVDTETNINNIVRKIRTALGDNAAKPRFLEQQEVATNLFARHDFNVRVAKSNYHRSAQSRLRPLLTKTG